MKPPCLDTLIYPLLIPQGVDWPGINFPIIGADGEPYDLSGCSAKAQVRPLVGTDELYFTWSTSPEDGEGLITLSGTMLNLRVLATESASWTFTSGVYDIVVTNPAAPIGLRVSRVAEGLVTVSREVTKL